VNFKKQYLFQKLSNYDFDQDIKTESLISKAKT
jgi:hypothetical protein